MNRVMLPPLRKLFIKIAFILGLALSFPHMQANAENMMPDSHDYTPLEKYMLSVAADDSLTYLEKCMRIYKALPARPRWSDFTLRANADREEKNYSIELKKRCLDIFDNAQYYVPVDMIISKYREIIEANPIDISEVADLRRIGPRGEYDDGEYIFIKNEWPRIDYLDDGIAMPDLPNLRYEGYILGKASPERQREFINELRCQSDDYVLNFMLIAVLSSIGADGGSYQPKSSSSIDNTVAYASFEQMRDFPQWYRAWNLLVPTMAQRWEGSYLDAQGDFPQRACGNLVEDEKYRMPLARYRELQAKNLIWRDYRE